MVQSVRLSICSSRMALWAACKGTAMTCILAYLRAYACMSCHGNKKKWMLSSLISTFALQPTRIIWTLMLVRYINAQGHFRECVCLPDRQMNRWLLAGMTLCICLSITGEFPENHRWFLWGASHMHVNHSNNPPLQPTRLPWEDRLSACLFDYVELVMKMIMDFKALYAGHSRRNPVWSGKEAHWSLKGMDCKVGRTLWCRL